MAKPGTDKPIQTNDQRRLIKRLGSRDAAERLGAREEFLLLATEDPARFREDLLAIINTMTVGGKRTTSRVFTFLGCAYFGLMPLFIVLSCLHDFEPHVALIAGGVAVLLTGTWIGGIGISWTANKARTHRLVEAVTDIADLTVLPPLIELLEFGNSSARLAILPLIARLLTQIHASDTNLLGFSHQSALARTFSTPQMSKFPDTFFLAVLQAFEQIGGSQVLPAVTWLAQGKSVAAKYPAVQKAAQTCEAELKARLSRQQTAATLLRPSSAAEAPHILLRPVVNAPDTAPHELLRPDNSPRKQTVPVMIRPQGVKPEILFNTLQRPEDPEHR